jgi:SAM-dependent methyltransferase
LDARIQAFFDGRPGLKQRVARMMFRTGVLLAPNVSSKARFVGRDHGLFRDALRDNSNRNGRELHSLMHLRHVLNALKRVGQDPGGEILEIGAGRAGLPVLLLLCGFDRVHVNEITNSVNRFDRDHLENLQVLASLMGVARRRLEQIVQPLHDGCYAIRPDMLRIHAFTDAARLEIAPGALTAIVSFTVLEHLTDPHGVFRHLRPALAPDGWMCHVVDMRDHEDFARPLQFLTVEASKYQNRLGAWCNRLRHSDFLEMFRHTGFELCASRVSNFNDLDDRKSTDFWKMMATGLDQVYRNELDPEDLWVSDEQIARLHPDYRHYSRADLSILQAEYVLRARQAEGSPRTTS